jgi:hypothetical protein
MRRLALAAYAFAGILAALAGCSEWLARNEGLDAATLPESVRPDYAVFAQRCSKCHSLARPLTSGIDEDAYWVTYVAKMRRQPESGISQEDTVVILRFLHYFSLEERRKKSASPPAPVPSIPAPTTASPIAPTAPSTMAPAPSRLEPVTMDAPVDRVF